MAQDELPPFTASRELALAQVVALNGIVLYGVYVLGWPWGTVLVLYWCETLMGACFIILRMFLHRGLTHKRGYYRRGQLTIQRYTKLRTPSDIKTETKPFGSFIAGFFTGTVVFSLVQGVFLGLLLGELEDQSITTVDSAAVKKGLTAMVLVMIGSFALDCVNLKERPFAWIRDLSERFMGRIFVVHLTVLFGLFAVKIFGLTQFPFILFAALKILLDLGGVSRKPQKPEWEERHDEEVMTKAAKEA